MNDRSFLYYIAVPLLFVSLVWLYFLQHVLPIVAALVVVWLSSVMIYILLARVINGASSYALKIITGKNGRYRWYLYRAGDLIVTGPPHGYDTYEVARETFQSLFPDLSYLRTVR